MVDLAEGENELKTVHKHWFMFFQEVIGYVLFLFVPFILYSIFVDSELPIGLDTTLSFDENTAIIVFWSTLWIIVMWTKIFHVWTDYYLDKWIVTNKRVIDIDQRGFFKREVSTFRMEKIQDVTVEIKGMIPTLLNFGNIHIQTAGASDKRFIIRGIHNPDALRRIIMTHYDLFVDSPRI